MGAAFLRFLEKVIKIWKEISTSSVNLYEPANRTLRSEVRLG